MKKFCVRSLCVFAGLAVVPATVTQADSQIPKVRPISPSDARLKALRKFFKALNCPVLPIADAFLAEAESHDLDWRLLPSLAVMESGGGRASLNNNIFGWDNGAASFPTVGAAIHEVAKTLSESRIYKNKSLLAMLRAYNPVVPEYADRVRELMHQISPTRLAAN